MTGIKNIYHLKEMRWKRSNFRTMIWNLAKQFDIIYAERWAKVGRYIKEIRQEGQIWVYDFLNVWNRKVTTGIIPYLDYAFFSYDRDDEYIRNFMVKTNEKGRKQSLPCSENTEALLMRTGSFISWMQKTLK